MWKFRRLKGTLAAPRNPELADHARAHPTFLAALGGALRTHVVGPELKASITEQIARGMTNGEVSALIRAVDALPEVKIDRPKKETSSSWLEDTLPEIKIDRSKTEASLIGFAWLEDDGSISMDFRIFSGGGCAMGIKHYKTTDEHYIDMLEHLGGLKPGERKPVESAQPWEGRS